jgi:hypothetical protein
MIYLSKKECYNDVLLSLLIGTVEEADLRHLRNYYEETEHYECCQGIAEAYVKYKQIKKDEAKNDSDTGREEAIDRLTTEN